jgi:hypothetical protein
MLAQDAHRASAAPARQSTRAHAGGMVCCAECRKQLPAERAVKLESDDQTHHFCALTCLRNWERLR